ncbi:MAG: zf-HC2 domain-containing protein [Clostridiales bacterium]|nr:zf-HC2 domain-containing protein [Clostridiales bacterium]
MNCGQVRELRTEYLDGALDPARKERLEAHIAECRACAREFALEKSLRNAVKAVGAEAPALPEGFHAGLMERLRAEENAERTDAASSDSGRPPFFSHFMRFSRVAAILAICVSVAFGASMLIQQIQDSRVYVPADVGQAGGAGGAGGGYEVAEATARKLPDTVISDANPVESGAADESGADHTQETAPDDDVNPVAYAAIGADANTVEDAAADTSVGADAKAASGAAADTTMSAAALAAGAAADTALGASADAAISAASTTTAASIAVSNEAAATTVGATADTAADTTEYRATGTAEAAPTEPPIPAPAARAAVPVAGAGAVAEGSTDSGALFAAPTEADSSETDSAAAESAAVESPAADSIAAEPVAAADPAAYLEFYDVQGSVRDNAALIRRVARAHAGRMTDAESSDEGTAWQITVESCEAGPLIQELTAALAERGVRLDFYASADFVSDPAPGAESAPITLIVWHFYSDFAPNP